MLSIRHILFSFDFSVQGVQAAPFVRALAQRFNARVTLFSTGSPAWNLPAGIGPPGNNGAGSSSAATSA